MTQVPNVLPTDPRSSHHFSAELHLDHWQTIVHVLDAAIELATDPGDERALYKLQQTRNEVLNELQHKGVEFTEEEETELVVGFTFVAKRSYPVPEMEDVEGENFSYDIQTGEEIQIIERDESTGIYKLLNLSLQASEAWVLVDEATLLRIKG